jgi:CheY-like chemotaxis protein
MSQPAGETILIVDDSPVDAHLAAGLISRRLGMATEVVSDGSEALDWLQRNEAALVLTDLQMPRLDGLSLVREMSVTHPDIPVVLTTASGSEEVAFQALQAGAASYVPKMALAEQLAPALDTVLAVARAGRRKQKFLEGISRLEMSLTMENDEALVPVFVQHVSDYVVRLGLCDARGRLRLAVALEEALLNGILHGNLEVGSELKEGGADEFRLKVEERKKQAPYKDRRLHIDLRLSRERGEVVIRDEGPGFDLRQVPDPTDPENLARPSGRGLLLIGLFMHEVRHNARGNEITMVRLPQKG